MVVDLQYPINICLIYFFAIKVLAGKTYVDFGHCLKLCLCFVLICGIRYPHNASEPRGLEAIFHQERAQPYLSGGTKVQPPPPLYLPLAVRHNHKNYTYRFNPGWGGEGKMVMVIFFPGV